MITHIHIERNKMTQYVLAAANWFDFSRVVNYYNSIKSKIEKENKVRATINELSKLTDKELADIGLSRGMIRSVAMDAYK